MARPAAVAAGMDPMSSTSEWGTDSMADTSLLSTNNRDTAHVTAGQLPGDFKEPYPGVVLRQNGAQYYPSTPGSSAGSPTDPRDTSASSLNSDKTSIHVRGSCFRQIYDVSEAHSVDNVISMVNDELTNLM